MKRAEHQPQGVSLVIYAGIFAKTWHVADVGTLLPQHAHEHPHLTLVMRGAVRVWRGDELDGDYFAPATLKIPAREPHSFLTLTDNVVLACVHAVGEADEPAIFAEHQLELEE
jgi:quercetin dioxygenase-like cupin family protein